MNTFGNYAIATNKKVNLEKEPSWWWLFKAPSVRDDIAMSKFMVSGREVINAAGERTIDPRSVYEIAVKELSLLFGGTNIPSSEDPDKPFITITMDDTEIESKIGQMPRELVWEIWTALNDVVPGWGKAPDPKA